MRSRLPDSASLRALVGALALYGLLLQAFLAAATTAPRPAASGVICAEHGSGAPANDGPVRHDHQCCTAAVQAGTLAPPPEPGFAAAWPPRAEVLVAWRPEASVLRTGPPTRAHSARGPPAA